MNKFNSFLGTGWAFPPSFDKAAGSVNLVSNEEDIRQSLNILLSTTLGERVMQPRYGCNLETHVFNTLNSSVIGYIKDMVQNAILYHEPRILADKIDVATVDAFTGQLNILVEYIIPGTNSRFNYVYDYYLKEATQPV
ncbi:MAG TPA: GPW/gp25 family protein [Chitinophagaceae bacterium]|nr:GPW/gp25 family protein [Chitinophagaceae bacterium]